MTEIIVSSLLLLGCLFTLVAGIGLVRMPDFYCRMQAIGKGTTLGVALVMLGVAIYFADTPGASSRAVVVILFLFVTSPASGQMLSRAAYLLRTEKSETKDSLANHPAWRKYAPTRPPKGE
jgi:multicomponent Na+:H+ antiporter subunit G